MADPNMEVDPPNTSQAETSEVGTSGIDTKALCEELTSKAQNAVRAAAALPKKGQTFELYNVNNKVLSLNKNFRGKIFNSIRGTLASSGYMLSGRARMDDMIELVRANDHLLERATIEMDSYENEGDETFIRGVDGSMMKFNDPIGKDSSGRYANLATGERANISSVQKPQQLFSDHIDNSNGNFIPKLSVKHHTRDIITKNNITEAVNDRSEVYEFNPERPFDHPYLREITTLSASNQLFDKSLKSIKDFASTPYIYVDSEKKLLSLVKDLNAQKEFAVDLEHHDFRTYLGLTCLMQISTRDQDYIVDPFPIWGKMHILNEPFSNFNILKVFHGAASDIVWLQRDFGIYVVNMIDTFEFMKALNFQKKSYQALVLHSAGINLDKRLQKSDWRMRPLSDLQVQYARCDTHYLLHCFDKLCEKLKELCSCNNGEVLRNQKQHEIYEASKLVSLKVFEKPIFNPQGYRLASVKELNNRQAYILEKLWQWRDTTARDEDESVQYVLPVHMMFNISEVLPRETQGIIACCAPVPTLLRRDIFLIHKFVTAARDLPLEEKARYMSELSIQDQVKNRLLQQNIYTKAYAQIDARFDQREYKVEDDKPDLKEKFATRYDDKKHATKIKIKAQPLLPFRTASTLLNIVVGHNLEQFKKRFDEWKSPYMCYLVALEMRKDTTDDQNKSEGQFSHHCPAPPRSTTVQITEPVREEPMDVAAPTEASIRNKRHRRLQGGGPPPKSRRTH